MGWAKIKKAINSTLGTDEFKPLDKLIQGEKRLIANDTILGIARDDSRGYGFTPKVDGAIKVYVSLTYSGNNSRTGCHIKLNNITDGTSQNGVEFNCNSNITRTDVFTVQKDKRYTVSLDQGAGYGTATMTYAEYRGQIVDFNYFTID